MYRNLVPINRGSTHSSTLLTTQVFFLFPSSSTARLRPAPAPRSIAVAAAASSSSASSPSSSSETREKKKTKTTKRKPPSPSPTLEATATPLPPKSSLATAGSSSFPKQQQQQQQRKEYQWRAQWFPVCYLEDLRDSPGPIRVSLFDEPIALALKGGNKKKKKKSKDKNVLDAAAVVGEEEGELGQVIALADQCSHRGAALSEGRVTAAGCLQCPYHAWTFDASGSCVAIPHAPGAAQKEAEKEEVGGKKKNASSSSCRTKVRAYAATVSQGLVWLSLSPPEEAPPLSRLSTLPELDLDGWVSNDFVRDFAGIDATLLIQNVADPDHGLFAHQTPSFDAFSAAAGMPMRVSTRKGGEGGQEEDDENSKTVIVGRVEAAPVLADSPPPSSPPSSPSVAELIFEPPCHVRWARMDEAKGGRGGREAKFIAAFWVTPLGLGRSRLFIRYARSVFPRIPVPRPLLAIGLNGFLDQDSMVVASQALRVARAEAAAAKEEEEEEAKGEIGKHGRSHVSRSLFAYRSPTESFLASVASWLDSALPSAPGRDAASLARFVAKLESSSASSGGGGGYPDREEVLDRFKYHTALVPSSRKVWESAKKVEAGGRAVALVAAAAALATATTATAGTLPAPLLAAAAALASLSSFAAADVASRFEYIYTRERQVRDLERVAELAPGVERATKDERV